MTPTKQPERMIFLDSLGLILRKIKAKVATAIRNTEIAPLLRVTNRPKRTAARTRAARARLPERFGKDLRFLSSSANRAMAAKDVRMAKEPVELPVVKKERTSLE